MAGIDGNTKGCFHFNNSGTDSSTAGLSFSLQGGATYSTSSPKFGSHSLSVPSASSSYGQIADNAALDYGTGDFTWDYWAKFSTDKASYIAYRSTIAIRYFSSTIDVFMGSGATNRISTAWTPTLGQWYHHALTRSGSNLRFFVDGTQIGSTGTDSQNLDAADAVTLGQGAGANFMDGFIDEFRMSNVARWTANFTPPSSEYTVDNTGSFLSFF